MRQWKDVKPLVIIEHIDDDILPLSNADQLNIAHFRLEAYLVPLPAQIPSCCTHQSISLHYQ
jgi:hypothetical protein